MGRVSDLYRTAFVTGASTGLGREFARMLLAEGVIVWGTSRDPARLAEVRQTVDGRLTLLQQGNEAKLEQMRITRGDTMISNKSAVGVPRAKAQYLTGTVYTGVPNGPVPGFAGDTAFTISVKRGNTRSNKRSLFPQTRCSRKAMGMGLPLAIASFTRFKARMSSAKV